MDNVGQEANQDRQRYYSETKAWKWERQLFQIDWTVGFKMQSVGDKVGGHIMETFENQAEEKGFILENVRLLSKSI